MSESAIFRIPFDQLESETLRGVVAEFVSREGTDYGHTEVSLDEKIGQVLKQLKARTAVLIFDSTSETTTIVRSDDPILAGAE